MYFFKSLFTYFEGERGSMCAHMQVSWGGAEREGESTPSRLHTVSADPNVGLGPTNQEIMT